jgi:hypothetical protein
MKPAEMPNGHLPDIQKFQPLYALGIMAPFPHDPNYEKEEIQAALSRDPGASR